MRYFRDLGVDAHLFMYKNEQELFLPENDTYEIDKYQPYIHVLPLKANTQGLLFLKKVELKEMFKDFDSFIGCGMAPAIFLKLGIELDIFIPHDDGLENTVYPELSFKQLFRSIARSYVVKVQVKGLQENTKKVIASEIQEVQSDSISRLNLSKKCINKYLLMVYREELKESDEIREISAILKKYDFIVFSHTRHIWHKRWITNELMEKYGGKGLDKLIIGYGSFIKKNPQSNALLVLFEYGSDVDDAKEIIRELQIEKHVLWLKRMPRKEILQLIDYADIVVDALSATMWGGVGWEGLSRGKILMQNIEQSDEEYYKKMGHNLPFIMRANSSKRVEEHLNSFINNREFYIEKAKENSQWFDKYAGLGLAKEYLKLLDKTVKENR